MDGIEITGKTVKEAVEKALLKLEKTKDEIEFVILEEPSKGFLGIGAKPALIKVMPKNIAVAAESESVIDEISMTDKNAESTEPEADAEQILQEHAEIGDKANQFLQNVLDKMQIEVTIEKMVTPEKIILHIHGKNLGILIGKHGQTLDSLQYLTNLVANRNAENRMYIMVDVENYRTRREETLIQLAQRLAMRVKNNHNKIILEPMNGYERKIIHMALQDIPYVRTESEGEDPYRHIVIYYNR